MAFVRLPLALVCLFPPSRPVGTLSCSSSLGVALGGFPSGAFRPLAGPAPTSSKGSAGRWGVSIVIVSQLVVEGHNLLGPASCPKLRIALDDHVCLVFRWSIMARSSALQTFALASDHRVAGSEGGLCP